MTPSDEHIRDLLGKAFDQEPPLRLDREEIFRRGRRGVRIRRLATSGGVAATVVAVVLGAAALSNLPGEDAVVTPAQESSSSYPPTTTTPAPFSVSTSPETAPQGPQLPLTTFRDPGNAHAAVLTQVLAEAKLLPVSGIATSDGSAPLVFVVVSRSQMYQAGAELRTAGSAGHVLIQVARTDPRRSVSCAELTGQYEACSVGKDHGLPTLTATERSRAGLIRYVVRVVRPDGTDLMISSGNTSVPFAEAPIIGPTPPVDFEVLKRIAALPRLTFG